MAAVIGIVVVAVVHNDRSREWKGQQIEQQKQRVANIAAGVLSPASCNSGVALSSRVDVAVMASVTTDSLGCTVQNW